MLHGQVFLALAQCFEQLFERIAELQAAQAGGVRRADVDRDIACVGVDLVQADQVVIHGALDRGIEVLADVDAQHALVLRRLDPRDQVIDAVIVEAHAVDDRGGLRQAEDARLGVARLRTRGNGADLDETEAQLGEAINGIAVLVQAGRQSHGIGELQAHHLHRQAPGRLRQQAIEAQAAAGTDQVDGQFMGGFRGELEQELAGQAVHGRASVGKMGRYYSQPALAQARRRSASSRPESSNSSSKLPCTPE